MARMSISAGVARKCWIRRPARSASGRAEEPMPWSPTSAGPTEGAWDKLNPLEETGVGATQADEVPLRRFGKMDELRNLLIFLMSDGCSYITGDTISIDGGHHLAAPSTFAGLAKLSPADWQRAREAIQASVQKEKQARSI